MTGQRIRDLRIAAGMTQYELSRRLGISPSAVGMYEQNRRVPDRAMLLKLCELFRTTADWLLYGQAAGSVSEAEAEPADVRDFLREVHARLMSLSGRLFFTPPSGGRRALTRVEMERLWQGMEVAAEVALRLERD